MSARESRYHLLRERPTWEEVALWIARVIKAGCKEVEHWIWRRRMRDLLDAQPRRPVPQPRDTQYTINFQYVPGQFYLDMARQGMRPRGMYGHR